jgi:DNA modification methylase
MNRLLDSKYEPVLLFAKTYNYEHIFNQARVRQKYSEIDPRSKKYNPRGRSMGSLVRVPAYRPPNIKQQSYHVAAFPEELVQFFLTLCTSQDSTILDPFLGSGTSLKVAAAMGRKGLGYEVNPNYRQLIEKRISEEWIPPPIESIDMLLWEEFQPEGLRRPKMGENHSVRKHSKSSQTSLDSKNND